VGIICASCAATIYPDAGLVWNPALLLTAVQEHEAPAARAAVFFASVPILLSQILITVTGSCVAGGIDMSGLCPKFVNLRRGAYAVLCIGILMQPWQLANTSNKFISVMGAYSIFLAPLTGLLHCEYFLVRKQRLCLSDLYKPNASSSYWYFHGVNPRTLVSFTLGFTFFLPGFIHSVTPGVKVAKGWNELFYMCYPLGYFGTGIIHYTINYFFPVPELGKVDDVDYFGTFGASQLPYVQTITGVVPPSEAEPASKERAESKTAEVHAASDVSW
jgi:NCS1 family nucleobase:cation symporter-1